MMATKQSYAAEEAAGRVVPAVAPLAVDRVPEVRHAALATLQAFVKLLQDHSASRDAAAGAAEGTSQQVRCCTPSLHAHMRLHLCIGCKLPQSAATCLDVSGLLPVGHVRTASVVCCVLPSCSAQRSAASLSGLCSRLHSTAPALL